MDELGRFRDVVDQKNAAATGRPLEVRSRAIENVFWGLGVVGAFISLIILFFSPPLAAIVPVLVFTALGFGTAEYNRRQRIREEELMHPAKHLSDF